MNPWRGLKGLPRPIWIYAAAMFINRAGTMALPFLALYATRSLGYTASQAGVVLTCYGLGMLITGPFAGRVSDAITPLRLMRLSLFTTAAVVAVIPFITRLEMLMAVTFVWATINEAFRPAALALITDVVLPEQRKSAFAVHRLSVNLGMSIGPAIGGMIFLISYHMIFWVDAATTLLAAVLLVVVPLGVIPRHAASSAATIQHQRIYHDRRFVFFFAALLPILTVFFTHSSAMPLYLVRNLGLTETDYGLMFTINTVLIILIEVPLNLAMSHWEHRRALAVGAFLAAVGYGALALASGFWSAAATVVVWTFGEMVLLPTSSTYVADIAPAHRRGEYMGMYQLSFGIAYAASSWLGTSVLDHFGGAALWGGAFVVGCASAVMLWHVKTSAVAE